MALDRFRPAGADLGRPINTRRLRVIILVADTFSTNLQPGEEGKFWLDDLALQLTPLGDEASRMPPQNGAPQLNIGPRGGQ